LVEPETLLAIPAAEITLSIVPCSTRSPTKRDFGYLQSISFKDENHLWVTMCKLKKEKTECFAANVERNFPIT
jgi:hypothetical protein